MNSISLCMIVKNEENSIRSCLDSVRDLVDEIVVVDTGSTDGTKDIVREYTPLLFDFTWCDDFAAARNYAFEKGTMDYLMWLDADDVVEASDREAFAELKKNLEPDTDVVMMKYNTAFDKQGNPSFTYYRERLLRRSHGFRWEGAVHECITPAGKIVWWDAAITHRKTSPGNPDRNLNIYNNMLKNGKELGPRAQFYYARELIYHHQDLAAAAWIEQYLKSGKGWIENILQACIDLAGCYERLGRPEDAFSALVRALRYSVPRPELLCELGLFFFRRKMWEISAYWYNLALECPGRSTAGGFSLPDCKDYIPLMQLCLCHYNMGNVTAAKQYNEIAGEVKPNSPSYLYNKKFFAGLDAKN